MDVSLALLRVRKLFAGFRTAQARGALTMGVAPSVEHLTLLRHIEPNTVVDVGANGGQFALAVRTIVPDARIFCFEPGRVAFDRLNRVFEQDDNVTPFRAAIAPDIGRLQLNITAADDSSSFFPVSNTQTEVFGTLVETVEEVEAGPLSHFISPDSIRSPSLLKIDVQGFEGEVIIAAAEMIDRFDWIYVECSFEELYIGQKLAPDIIDSLARLGFDFAGAFNQVTAPGFPALQADLLFRRRQSRTV